MKRIKKFISDMKKELDRIRWCKGKELVKNAIVTIIFIIFFAIFFTLIEYIVTLIMRIDFSNIVERIEDLF
ncbi:MAG: preprotein translocase subunit SecE [Bacilli bacterium]|nr:preprotein translocase subunit SecE [Bacilli bacterium]